MQKATPPEKEITVADLYPNLTREQHVEVEETFRDYLEIVWRVYERLKSGQAGSMAFDRTPDDSAASTYRLGKFACLF